MKKFLRLFFICAFLFSFMSLAIYFATLYEADAAYRELLAKNSIDASTLESSETDSYIYRDLSSDLSIDYDAVKEKSPDYIGWLNIPNTEISYPAMYLEGDNDFYLHRLPDGTKNFAGSLFLDGNSTGINSENLIIYGHNMKNGSMFGRLKKFTNKEYFDAHPYIELHTEHGVRFYIIFSVRKVLREDQTTYVVDGFDKKEYIKNAVNENKYSYKELTREFDYQDIERHVVPQLITLSTCTEDSKYRLVVNAIRIK